VLRVQLGADPAMGQHPTTSASQQNAEILRLLHERLDKNAEALLPSEFH
jgi:hypothetical protein